MRTWILASTFAVLFFLGVFTNSFAQQLPDHVVINEVDTNPPGDDAKTVSEWAELYNPTGTDVDIGGWKIASTTITKKTLTIPIGTTIKSGQFLVYSYTSLWFTDVSEKVQLRDNLGNVIDETPVITDQKNDFSSWQRKFDGFDTDASNDWTFRTSSAGSSNGRLDTGQAASGAISISIDTDKTSYIFGDTATISGNVSKRVYQEKPYFTQAQLKIIVDGPGIYQKTITLYPDANLEFKTSLKLDRVLGVTAGNYVITATYDVAKDVTGFSVGDKLAPEVTHEESELTISTDKAAYLPGQRVQISAHTTEITPLQGLAYSVYDSKGTRIFSGKLFPTENGDFSVPIFMTTVNPVYGIIDIVADYGKQHVKTTFELVKDIKDTEKIVLNTDKAVYGLGETVVISGRSNKYVAALDLEVIQTGTTAIGQKTPSVFKLRDQITLAGDSTFEYKLQIPSDQLRLGDYSVTVSKEFGKATTFFKIAENPEETSGIQQGTYISTDKTSYKIGEKLTISGHVIPKTKSTFEPIPVSISLKDESGKPITFFASTKQSKGLDRSFVAEYGFTAIPDAVGNYKIETTVNPSAFKPGAYVLEAKYDKSVTSTLFSVTDKLDTSNVGVNAALDKSIYGLGETVNLQGTLLSGQSAVKITLTKPDGKTLNGGAKIDNSKFSWSWTIPQAGVDMQDSKASGLMVFGAYKVTVSSASETVNLFFKVSKNPETDTLEIKPLSVTTDKPVYQAGEKLIVLGDAIKRQQTSSITGGIIPDRVNIQVKYMNNKVIYDSSVLFDIIGHFQSSYDLPLTVFKDGTYRVVATYQGLRSETTFDVKNNIPVTSSGKLTITLTTDKGSYSPGDTVQITGSTNKVVSLTHLDLAIVSQEDTKITCGTAECGLSGKKIDLNRYYNNGLYKYDYVIPSTAKLGTYVINADTDFGTFTTTFDVVARSAIPAAPISPISEKFNRITDTITSITLSEKDLQGWHVAPSSIKGSLVIARGSENSVNIMITADDGTCVIGQVKNCLVSSSTKNNETSYKIISSAGLDYKVTYSGPDVFLETFSIEPSDGSVFSDSIWTAQITKDSQPSKFYYEITYKPIQ